MQTNYYIKDLGNNAVCERAEAYQSTARSRIFLVNIEIYCCALTCMNDVNAIYCNKNILMKKKCLFGFFPGVFGAGKSYLLAVTVLFLVQLFNLSEHNQTTSSDREWKVLIASTTNVAVDRILLG